MKKFFLLAILIILTCVFQLRAEDITFEISAPQEVVAGKQFRLSYTVNATEGKDFRLASSVSEDFDILMGPSVSTSSSVSIVNGERKKTVAVTYAYVLMAKKNGSFRIGPATIKINEVVYQSEPFVIEVFPAEKEGSLQNTDEEQEVSSADITDTDIFIRLIVSGDNVYEQEGFLVTYKLYTVYDIASLNRLKIPDFEGFLSHRIGKENPDWKLEQYNGRNYNTVILDQTILYPQHSGRLNIGQAETELSVRMRKKQASSRSFFDGFFDYNNVSKTIVSPAAVIHVKPLPSSGKPASFKGLVGENLMLHSSVAAGTAHVNDTIVYTLSLKGSGNIKWMNVPSVNFPEGFNLVDTDFSFDIDRKTDMKTVKTFTYKCIPQKEGNFKISDVDIFYFDPKANAYLMVSSEPQDIFVGPGATGVLSEEKTCTEKNQMEDKQAITSNVTLEKDSPVKNQNNKTLFLGIIIGFVLIVCIFSILFLKNSIWRILSLFLSLIILLVCLFLLLFGNKRKPVEKFFTETDKEEVSVKKEKTDVIILLDISGSMLAEDLKPNRLEATKNALKSFIQTSDDNIGMVLFAGESYTRVSLTPNQTSLHDHLAQVEIVNPDEMKDGTAIGTGIINAVNNLRNSYNNQKVILLLTDGVNTMGDIAPVTASEIAKKMDICIYTIGLSSYEDAPYPVKTNSGIKYQDIRIDIDESILKNIASITGGTYYRAASNHDLDDIFSDIHKQIKLFQGKNSRIKQEFDYINTDYTLSILDAFRIEEDKLRKQVEKK